jgi:Holliday junction resolvase
MSATTPEGKVKRKLVEMLKQEGVWYFFPAANGMGRAGIPDVIGVVKGQFVGIECKADATKKPTALQMQCAAHIKAAGGAWFLVFDDASTAGVRDWIRRC